MIAEFLRRNTYRPARRHANPHAVTGVNNPDFATIDLTERMKKVESTLETLVRLLPQSESRDSVEPQPPDENDGFQGRFTLILSASRERC